MEMSRYSYDYIIIGAGAAGLHLAISFIESASLSSKQILIIDPDEKKNNDRTWCFWEKGPGKWDHIVAKSWRQGFFMAPENEIPLDMGAYQYKMVRGIDFYNNAREVLSHQNTVSWIQDSVVGVYESEVAEVVCSSGKKFTCEHVFDSRHDYSPSIESNRFAHVRQHFLGWLVKTSVDVFNSDAFVMMDTRVVYKDSTCFTYVLPVSAREALVEFTLFTNDLIERDEYEKMLRQYISQILGLNQHSILETEYGVIPMTDYNFHSHHSKHITKIGTAGGWVKPATGYSFKNAERFSAEILKNIAAGHTPSLGIAVGRHRKYDILLLDILSRQNHLGRDIFQRMYENNPAFKIFNFLDETSTLWDDIRIIASLNPKPFIGALFRNWRKWIN